MMVSALDYHNVVGLSPINEINSPGRTTAYVNSDWLIHFSAESM